MNNQMLSGSYADRADNFFCNAVYSDQGEKQGVRTSAELQKNGAANGAANGVALEQLNPSVQQQVPMKMASGKEALLEARAKPSNLNGASVTCGIKRGSSMVRTRSLAHGLSTSDGLAEAAQDGSESNKRHKRVRTGCSQEASVQQPMQKSTDAGRVLVSQATAPQASAAAGPSSQFDPQVVEDYGKLQSFSLQLASMTAVSPQAYKQLIDGCMHLQAASQLPSVVEGAPLHSVYLQLKECYTKYLLVQIGGLDALECLLEENASKVLAGVSQLGLVLHAALDRLLSSENTQVPFERAKLGAEVVGEAVISYEKNRPKLLEGIVIRVEGQVIKKYAPLLEQVKQAGDDNKCQMIKGMMESEMKTEMKAELNKELPYRDQIQKGCIRFLNSLDKKNIQLLDIEAAKGLKTRQGHTLFKALNETYIFTPFCIYGEEAQKVNLTRIATKIIEFAGLPDEVRERSVASEFQVNQLARRVEHSSELREAVIRELKPEDGSIDELLAKLRLFQMN